MAPSADQTSEERRPINLTRHEAVLAHYALGTHASRQGDPELVEACERAQAALREAWGDDVGLVLA